MHETGYFKPIPIPVRQIATAEGTFWWVGGLGEMGWGGDGVCSLFWFLVLSLFHHFVSSFCHVFVLSLFRSLALWFIHSLIRFIYLFISRCISISIYQSICLVVLPFVLLFCMFPSFCSFRCSFHRPFFLSSFIFVISFFLFSSLLSLAHSSCLYCYPYSLFPFLSSSCSFP